MTETLKWRSPCYRAHEANILMMDALSDAAFLSFFKGVLLDDPEGGSRRRGPIRARRGISSLRALKKSPPPSRRSAGLSGRPSRTRRAASRSIFPMTISTCPRNWPRRWPGTRSWPRPSTP
ncbi:hypothetical protein ACFSZS_10605 [Seohaeicola zhoushanensis]